MHKKFRNFLYSKKFADFLESKKFKDPELPKKILKTPYFVVTKNSLLRFMRRQYNVNIEVIEDEEDPQWEFQEKELLRYLITNSIAKRADLQVFFTKILIC